MASRTAAESIHLADDVSSFAKRRLERLRKVAERGSRLGRDPSRRDRGSSGSAPASDRWCELRGVHPVPPFVGRRFVAADLPGAQARSLWKRCSSQGSRCSIWWTAMGGPGSLLVEARRQAGGAWTHSSPTSSSATTTVVMRSRPMRPRRCRRTCTSDASRPPRRRLVCAQSLVALRSCGSCVGAAFSIRCWLPGRSPRAPTIETEVIGGTSTTMGSKRGAPRKLDFR